MDKNDELLNYIHQNSEMGKKTIKQLIDISKDETFKTMLKSEYDEYDKINTIAEQKLKQRGRDPMDVNPISKASTHLMINVNTLTDKTPSHMSEMMIQGSTMGIVDMTKRLKEYQEADHDIVDLANKLLLFEQNNIEECKKYLQ